MKRPVWFISVALVSALAITILLVRPWRASPSMGPLPAGAHLLPDGSNYWKANGFVPMEPPVRLPTDRRGLGRVEVELLLPRSGVIRTRHLADQDRTVLSYPPGTIADRVEYRRRSGGLIVADVRGTRIAADGHEIYRLYRPRDGASPPGSEALFGYEWPRDNAAGRKAALTGFREAMGRGMGFAVGQRGLVRSRRHAAIGRFMALASCSSCHMHSRPATFAGGNPHRPRRATDGQGFYQVQEVLTDAAPLETYRPRDPNVKDRFIHYECSQGAKLRGPQGTTRVRCGDGRVPRLVLDVRAALAAGDKRVGRLCAARRYLAAHLDAQGRVAFHDALAACGIHVSSSGAAGAKVE